jgi:hypothetical protein
MFFFTLDSLMTRTANKTASVQNQGDGAIAKDSGARYIRNFAIVRFQIFHHDLVLT